MPAYLEDYADIAEGLLSLYEATFEPRYFTAAVEAAEAILELFPRPGGGFYDTGEGHDRLVTRPRDVQDNAVPSGNAMAATVLLRLSVLTGEAKYGRAAEAALSSMSRAMESHPLAFSQWLCALTWYVAKPQGVAVVGELDAGATQAMLKVVSGAYLPFVVTAFREPTEESPIPLLHGRGAIQGRPTAYVCTHFTCQAPTTEPEVLKAQLFFAGSA